MVHTGFLKFRPITELNLIDNFLFHKMIDDKETGEEFCRILLRTVLNKEIRHIKITPQKELYGLDTDIQNMIKEEPSFDYNDGALKMILYTKGKAGNASKELQDMLKYFKNSVSANVTNPDIEFIHHVVGRLKEQGEINLDYMKSWEWDEYTKKAERMTVTSSALLFIFVYFSL